MMKRVLAFLLVLVLMLPAAALADDPPRTLQYGLSGTDVLAAHSPR